MINPRRMATAAALIVLLSTLAATPIAFAANCEAGFVGPYGTACGGDEELEPVVVIVKPPVGTKNTILTVRPFATNPTVLIPNRPGSTSPAVGLGNVIFNGVPDTFATKQDVKPEPGKKSIVVAIPGNPVKVTVSGFRRNGTTRVEVLVQVSGAKERTRLGFIKPSSAGTVMTPAVTVKQGDSATFTLNQWKADGTDIDYKAGLVSQSVVSVTGTGVASGRTNQLSGR